MTWLEHHRRSEELAYEAEAAARHGDAVRASTRYAQAAEAEEQALASLDSAKVRTVGITAVSAAALYFKAEEYQEAARVAQTWLANPTLPEFARLRLQEMCAAIPKPPDQDQPFTERPSSSLPFPLSLLSRGAKTTANLTNSDHAWIGWYWPRLYGMALSWLQSRPLATTAARSLLRPLWSARSGEPNPSVVWFEAVRAQLLAGPQVLPTGETASLWECWSRLEAPDREFLGLRYLERLTPYQLSRLQPGRWGADAEEVWLTHGGAVRRAHAEFEKAGLLTSQDTATHNDAIALLCHLGAQMQAGQAAAPPPPSIAELEASADAVRRDGGVSAHMLRSARQFLAERGLDGIAGDDRFVEACDLLLNDPASSAAADEPGNPSPNGPTFNRGGVRIAPETPSLGSILERALSALFYLDAPHWKAEGERRAGEWQSFLEQFALTTFAELAGEPIPVERLTRALREAPSAPPIIVASEHEPGRYRWLTLQERLGITPQERAGMLLDELVAAGVFRPAPHRRTAYSWASPLLETSLAAGALIHPLPSDTDLAELPDSPNRHPLEMLLLALLADGLERSTGLLALTNGQAPPPTTRPWLRQLSAQIATAWREGPAVLPSPSPPPRAWEIIATGLSAATAVLAGVDEDPRGSLQKFLDDTGHPGLQAGAALLLRAFCEEQEASADELRALTPLLNAHSRVVRNAAVISVISSGSGAVAALQEQLNSAQPGIDFSGIVLAIVATQHVEFTPSAAAEWLDLTRTCLTTLSWGQKQTWEPLERAMVQAIRALADQCPADAARLATRVLASLRDAPDETTIGSLFLLAGLTSFCQQNPVFEKVLLTFLDHPVPGGVVSATLGVVEAVSPGAPSPALLEKLRDLSQRSDFPGIRAEATQVLALHRHKGPSSASSHQTPWDTISSLTTDAPMAAREYMSSGIRT